MHMNIGKLSLLAVVALAAPACVSGSADDSTLNFGWQIEDVGFPEGDTVTCAESGATTVVVELTNLSNGTPLQVFSYPCGAGRGVSPVLASGSYLVTMRLLRGDNIEVSATTFPGPGEAALIVDRRSFPPEQFVVFEIQSFTTRWVITKTAAPGVPVSCLSVGAAQVEFTATKPPLAPFVFLFPCTDPQGITQAIPDGDYNLTFRLLSANNVPLSELSVPYSTPVNAPAVLTNPVIFTVN